MKDDDTPSKRAGDGPGHAPAPDSPAGTAPGGGRREPVFSDFDDDEDYEESERDTDYASAYEDDDEEYLDSPEADDPDDVAADWQVLGGVPETGGSARDADRNPWAPRVPASQEDDDTEMDAAGFVAASKGDLFEDEDEEPADDEPEDDWDDEEDYSDEAGDLESDPPATAHSWPLGLVIVGIVALVLLVAGGYGVIQQRAATQEEIRQLQASLATAGNPGELATSRDALRELEQRQVESQARIDALTEENRRLTDMVAGLETQLTAQQTAVSRAAQPGPAKVASPAATGAAPKAAPKPAGTAAGASAATGGGWFVNFSSYTQRGLAESWVTKLKPSAGKAIVATGNKDGRSYYRVRIVGLADRAEAEKVAGQLQSAHNLPPLWVGTE